MARCSAALDVKYSHAAAAGAGTGGAGAGGTGAGGAGGDDVLSVRWWWIHVGLQVL